MRHHASFIALLTLLIVAVIPGTRDIADAQVANRIYLPMLRTQSEAIIPPTTEVLTEETSDALTDISADGSTLTFDALTPQLAQIAPGDILVSDVNDVAPTGFLRKVERRTETNGNVVVETSDATLEEAVDTGSIDINRVLSASDVQQSRFAQGVSMASNAMPQATLSFNIDDVVIYDLDGRPETTGDQLRASGKLEVEPQVQFSLKVKKFQLQKLDFVVTVRETSSIEITASKSLEFLDIEKEIGKIKLTPFSVLVGVVPVVVVPRLTLSVTATGEIEIGITTSASLETTFTSDVRYEDGKGSTVGNSAQKFDYTPPSLFGKLEAKVGPQLSIGLLLYDLAGPQAVIDFYLEASATVQSTGTLQAELYAGIDVGIELTLDLVVRKFSYRPPLSIQVRQLLWSKTISNNNGSTTRVSVSSNGTQGDADSFAPSVSADGRYVAFQSSATNLVANDTNGDTDVFVHDRETGQTTRVSAYSNGTQANGGSYSPSISGDGRYVAFMSLATNLVANDTNGEPDVFVHDRETGQSTRVSMSSNGTQGNDISYSPSISGDGLHVAFVSSATNLVTNDTNGDTDVFVHDREMGQTTRVSVSSNGTQGNDVSYPPSISGDGRYVAFMSLATNLVVSDTNESDDIFVHDRQTGQTNRVSVSSDGIQGNGNSVTPSISGDGLHVAFVSSATNLVANDTNGETEGVFVYDREMGQTTRVSVSSNGTQGNDVSYSPSISGDGLHVAFVSPATNLVANDTNGEPDVFVHDREMGQTTRVSVSSNGTQSNSSSSFNYYPPSISGEGWYVAFLSLATNLVANDTNGMPDIFVHDRSSTP